MKLPVLFPLYVSESRRLVDGTDVGVSEFCRKAFSADPKCRAHYESLKTSADGYFECPFGFTTRSFRFGQQLWAITGVVAHPRFGSDAERKRAKEFPAARVSREALERNMKFLAEVEAYRTEQIEQAAKVLPQALHELRKLNGAVLQHAEREINERGESRSLHSIRSAAELMRNSFEILEALSNIEGIRALPNDSTVNLFDLAYKMKRVYEEKARERGLAIQVNGVRAVVLGSQKSFPIVPAVLIENAIKYGTRNGLIRVDITTSLRRATLTVENQTVMPIDPGTCFERGVRFAGNVEGGGFGLYLAREVVRCHGGTIRCESRAGSVYMIVELPLHTVVPQPF